jgi:hypothetical protein
MDKWIRKLASDLGAEVVAELPKESSGPIGAAQAAGFYARRMEELRRQDRAAKAPGEALAIPVDESTFQALQAAAETLWPGQKVDAAKLGGNLLKGLAILILDQLAERLDEKKQAVRKTIDANDALAEAMQRLLNGTPKHSA